ncbi:MAG: hypothetical protein ACE5PM_07260 [Candidatus Hydrothermarchaeales archaeon]
MTKTIGLELSQIISDGIKIVVENGVFQVDLNVLASGTFAPIYDEMEHFVPVSIKNLVFGVLGWITTLKTHIFGFQKRLSFIGPIQESLKIPVL